MKQPKVLLLLTFLWLVSSCTPQPQPINYGSDGCEFCKMNIVDARHAAELVSKTGKVFKFDAIECMINYLEKNKDKEYVFYLVNCYDQPKQLIDAKSSVYLISKNIPSPMGAYLTAFSNGVEALKMQEIKGGKIYDWQELLDQLKVNDLSFSF